MEKEGGLGAPGFLADLAEHSTQVIFAYNVVVKQFIYLNPSFEVIWNKTRVSAFANPASLLETIHPKDREYLFGAFEKITDPTQEVEKKDIEFRIIHPDKMVRWLNLSTHLHAKGNDKILTGFVTDTTLVKENEANIQKFAGKKNSLLEILSHDLSGPLINIYGLSSLLAKEFKEYDNPKLDKMINMIAETSERSVGMIREFVKQEFLESVNVNLIKKRVNLVDVIGLTVEQYKASSKNLAKTFIFEFSQEEILVEIDEYKFSQVLNNLISNAIKFTRDNGKIIIDVEERDDTFLMVVGDDGVGIPAKYHKNIFEKFSKARRPGLKGEPSTGLGMSIIKTIVEWHGGRIWFESEENKGSTFYIELPVR